MMWHVMAESAGKSDESDESEIEKERGSSGKFRSSCHLASQPHGEGASFLDDGYNSERTQGNCWRAKQSDQ